MHVAFALRLKRGSLRCLSLVQYNCSYYNSGSTKRCWIGNSPWIFQLQYRPIYINRLGSTFREVNPKAEVRSWSYKDDKSPEVKTIPESDHIHVVWLIWISGEGSVTWKLTRLDNQGIQGVRNCKNSKNKNRTSPNQASHCLLRTSVT